MLKDETTQKSWTLFRDEDVAKESLQTRCMLKRLPAGSSNVPADGHGTSHIT
jgi:hypothetical protein